MSGSCSGTSRQAIPESTSEDGTEVELAPGPNLSPYAYPNTIREADGRLRFVVEGYGSKSVTSSVFGFQRLIDGRRVVERNVIG